MKTRLYIDGFNLYYGALKDTPYKWLNPQKLVEQICPKNQIVGIKYFTAAVSPQPGNPDARTRQQFYWRALKTLPDLEIIEGQFRVRTKRMKKVTPPPSTVEVFSTEEKGSDVNLATHLLMDGFLGDYEVAIVISGDSDLLTPIQMVREQLRKSVGVINPQLTTGPYKRLDKRGSCGLQRAASFYRDHLTDAKVASSLFPDTMTDATGAFSKPSIW
ncbi:MAG TPA: NYN domain-containing protein [Luteolibacter sp.]